MNFTQEEIEDLKEKLLDNWYDKIKKKALEIFYKEIQKEVLDDLTNEELFEMFESAGLLDEENEDIEYD